MKLYLGADQLTLEKEGMDNVDGSWGSLLANHLFSYPTTFFSKITEALPQKSHGSLLKLRIDKWISLQ